MPLRNRNNFPPGGFPFYQPETGWSASQHIGFDAVVSEIIAHRRANPRFNLSTDKSAVEAELERYTDARLQSIPGGEQYLIAGAPMAPPGSFTPPPYRPRNAGGVVPSGSLKDQIKTGIGTLIGWLGDGLKPVSQELATKRAETCLGCPKNQPSNKLSLSPAIGDAVKLMMQAKAEMKLSTPHDEKLMTCAACLCSLPTKVFVPLEHVWRNMKPEVVKDLDAGCWILSERNKTS